MKKEKQKIESQIRDFIASNLNVIEPNLDLIEVEYYLKNTNASTGFIDILAQDEFNQFVVIEIKRSNQASRSATNEVLKYLSLLKQNFKVNDSDVRFIIISTVWSELITPFSELYHQAKISIEGYEIKWEKGSIQEKKKVNPINKVQTRVFSPVQMVYLYKEFNKRFESGLNNIKKCLASIGLENYVILLLVNDKLKNNKFYYPYALYFVFLRMTENEYLQILSDEQREDVLTYKNKNQYNDGFENQYLNYLENNVMSQVTTTRDTAEYGYPEKLDAIISQGWKIFDIRKNGVLKNDPRLNDFGIINEIRGENGLNIGRYRKLIKKSHRSRFEEVKQQFAHCLSNNKTWNKSINSILQYVETKKGDQDITINIYNPPSILNTIYQFTNKQDKDYLPSFIISVKDSDENTLEIFSGHLSWNGKITKFKDFLNKLYENKGFELMLALSGDHLRYETLKTLGLEFETFYNKNLLTESLEDFVSQNRISPTWNRCFYPISFDSNGNFKIIDSDNYDFAFFISKNSSEISALNRTISEFALFL